LSSRPNAHRAAEALDQQARFVVIFAPGIAAALGAAVLFGTSAPFAKLLVVRVDPWMLAALLYLGSGLGLWLTRRLRRAPPVTLPRDELAWFAGAILMGGVVAPVLMMLGLARMPASTASLLLNAEGVLTALIAWFVFRENVDRRIAAGMLAIVLGAVVLAWPNDVQWSGGIGSLMILGACLAWAIDNNLTRRVSLSDAAYIAMSKGLVAGGTNLALAFAVDAAWPGWQPAAMAAVLGFASYGVSLVLFVVALRHLGTARTGAYFSAAPFVGAFLAIPLLGEALTLQLASGATLMLLGLMLHLTERHAHRHTHEPVPHMHEHKHDAGDEHHDHAHDYAVSPGTVHTHWHEHASITHTHAHFPDAHHRHTH